MRVLVVTNMYPSADEPQFGSFVKEQVEDLRALGIDIDVFFFDARDSWTKYPQAARTIRRLVSNSRFDLVHAHYGLCGAIALAQRRVPVVTTFHGSDCSGAISWQVYVSWIAARGSTPIFVSKSGARRVRPGAPVIPAGVDVDLFRPIDRGHARRELGWPVDGRYVLFPSSRRVTLKRADLFESALARVAAGRRNVKAIYLEGYEREQVALIMNAVDVMLMTSDWEGSPVSVPVGDLPSVLKGLPGCAVVPRDPTALACAVVDAFDAGRPAALRTRAELSSRRRSAQRILYVYQSLLGP
jgi:Glycosyltransferase Family 4